MDSLMQKANDEYVSNNFDAAWDACKEVIRKYPEVCFVLETSKRHSCINSKCSVWFLPHVEV